MTGYLEPVDDSLPMRPSGAWAAKKLDYLERYIDVFETSMRDKWDIRHYVDLLGGPGKCRIRDSGAILLGSPLVALVTRHPFTRYFFADVDSRNTRALQQRCAASELYERVCIRTGDCNEIVTSVVDEIRRHGEGSLNLAFLDPQRIRDLRWNTVQKLASLGRMDLIVHYPEMGLNRYMAQAFRATGTTAVDQFFGGQEWREVYARYFERGRRGGIHRSLIDLYKGKLARLGYQVWSGDEPLMRSVSRETPLYRLLFASKHPLGHELWRKIIQTDVYGQRRLL